MEGMVPVEVRYLGILVARDARAREVGPAGAFVEVEAPLPVGTIVTLAPDGGPEIRARVIRVAEAGEGRGMDLRFAGLSDDARRYLASGLGQQPLDMDGPGSAPAAVAAPGAPAPVAAAPAAPAPAAPAPAAVEAAPGEADAPGAIDGESEITGPVTEPTDGTAPDGGNGRKRKRRRR
ncbi:MAG TPA: hypothetical protein VGQ83_27905 [Polyangia bacterium]